ncbi:MAG: hypothetical protein V3S30_05955 [Thermoanaerobaculia bacterium]
MSARNRIGWHQAVAKNLTASLLVLVATGCQAPQTAEEATTYSTPAPASSPVIEPAPLELVELIDGAQQIAAAVTAVPTDLQEGSAVWGYSEGGELVPIRRGTNHITCLADDPSDERFQVACYHDSLEPFMARGRALKAEGVKGPDRMQMRHDEIEAGTLALPLKPTTVYSFGGDIEIYDSATGLVDLEAGSHVYAIYTPYATEASTGLSTTPPIRGAPWIMRPGTPSAHIMIVPPKVAAANN